MPHKKLIARLQAGLGISGQDRDSLANMPHQIKTFDGRENILQEGVWATRCTIVMSGFLSRQKTVGARNQIFSFYVPGDIPDLHTLHLPVMEHDICSVGPSTVAFVPHSFLIDALMKSPALMRGFWRETLIDAAIYRERVGSLGSRQALARMAHLFCEFATRLDIVGLVKDNSFNLPLTQQILADALGLSTVHVNRTLQDLKRRNLIEWDRHVMRLPNRSALEAMAEFNPEYLLAGKYL